MVLGFFENGTAIVPFPGFKNGLSIARNVTKRPLSCSASEQSRTILKVTPK